jgi:prepilin-type N-terminal cleavage/methylation domain-containing protein
MKKSAGFTLVEFIIVLVIVSVLALIAAPVYKNRQLKNEELKAASYGNALPQETPLENAPEESLQASNIDNALKSEN